MRYEDLTRGVNSSQPHAPMVPGMHIEGLKSFIRLQYEQVSLIWGSWKLHVLKNLV